MGPKAGSGAGLVNSIVALEHAAIAAWAAIGEVLSGDARGYAQTIRAREVDNAARVAELVRGVGGTPPSARRPEDYAPLFPRMRTPQDALQFARDLEERLVRAYLEGLRLLPGAEQRRAAAQVAAAQDLADRRPGRDRRVLERDDRVEQPAARPRPRLAARRGIAAPARGQR